MEDWSRVGGQIRAARRRLGYTVKTLAEATHLSTRTINNLEHGHQHNYDDDTLAFVEAALGWDDGEIRARATGQRPRRTHPEDLRLVISAWPRLSEADRRLIVAMVRERRGRG